MTPEQRAAVEALRRCSFAPASHDKRFVRGMSERLENCPDKPLTEEQAARLAKCLHRYRRQHGACPCGDCRSKASRSEASRVPNKYEGLTKAGSGPCPCGASGTLFRRRGGSGPPRCAVCVGVWSGRPVVVTPHVFRPVPPSPYPWLGEERLDGGTLRRFCLACGEQMEVQPVKRGQVTRHPGFAKWYREHIPCRADWETEAKGEIDGDNGSF